MGLEWNYMVDIRPTWNNAQQSANWEASVRRHITWIVKTETGKLLLKSIKFFGKWVSISPYDGSQGTCNAFVDARIGTAKDGRPFGAMLQYSPHLYQKGTACHGGPGKDRGNLPDEVLFHELVHAFRRVSGKRARVDATGGLLYYDSNEEFHAILVTNIYLTDPTNKIKTGLVRDHQDGSPLEADLATSFDFFRSGRDAFALVKQFCADHPFLSKELAKVPATFNPIAAFLADPARAEGLSRSATAVIRDLAGWGVAAGILPRRI